MITLEQYKYYYVYEWWRPDSKECFYVGKGCGRRAWSYQNRNYLFQKVIDELVKKKLKPEVRIYKTNLTEAEAHRIERERMAFWHRAFTTLSNISGTYRRKAKQFKLLTYKAPPKRDLFPPYVKPKSLPLSNPNRVLVWIDLDNDVTISKIQFNRASKIIHLCRMNEFEEVKKLIELEDEDRAKRP